AVGQEVVQHIVDAIRFFLLAYHDAVSSSIGILDRLHKILISLTLGQQWLEDAPPPGSSIRVSGTARIMATEE
ncbi:MAG: hypothetical protein WBG32_12920, partial [Nodosilinea sp.]